MLTISGPHKQLEGAQDGAVEGPAHEGNRAGTGPLHGEAQPVVLVLNTCQSKVNSKPQQICSRTATLPMRIFISVLEMATMASMGQAHLRIALGQLLLQKYCRVR